MHLRTRRSATRGAASVTVAVLAAALSVVATGPSEAKSVATGDYAVTVAGTTYNPAAGRDVTLKDVRAAGPISVTGVHTTFTLDPATLGVYDYTLTGAAAPDRMVSAPTVVFASKVPVLTPAQLGAPVIKELQVRDDTLVAILSTAGGTLKVQAKDAPAGGIFQMEPEFAGDVELVHTLGPTLSYFTNPFTGKVNVGDGSGPVTSGPGAHQMLLGKDSPQVATKLAQGRTVTRWSVAPGGRLGGVLGEDAVELSAGAASCTSQCQAQNQVQGSLPVPPLPTNPVPIG